MAKNIKHCLIGLICLESAYAATQDLSQAWEKWMSNAPSEAIQILRSDSKNTPSFEANALLSLIYDQLGQADSSTFYTAQALKTQDFAPAWTYVDKNIIGWADGGTQIQEQLKEEDLLGLAMRNPETKDLIYEALTENALNRGKLEVAKKFAKQSNAVPNWMMIHGFPNQGNKGWNSVFSPENAIELNQKIPLADGTYTFWSPLLLKSPTGWVKAYEYIQSKDQVSYFYTEFNSPSAQNATLGFGHSGNFKIWANDTLVAGDPIIKNTGINTYQSPITLRAGLNRILVKLGDYGKHFGSPANFKLTLTSNQPITYINPAEFEGNKQQQLIDINHTFSNSPFTFNNKDQNPWIDLFKSIYYTHIYQLDTAKHYLQKLQKSYQNSGTIQLLLAEIALRQGNSIQYEKHLQQSIQNNPQSVLAWNLYLELIADKMDPEAWRKILNQIPENTKPKLAKYLILQFVLAAQNNNQAMALQYLESLEQFSYQTDILNFLCNILIKNNQSEKAIKLIKEQIATNHGNIQFAQIYFQALARLNQPKTAINFLQQEQQFNPDSKDYSFTLANLAFTAKNYDQSLEYLTPLLIQNPTNPDLIQLKYAIAVMQKDSAEARVSLENLKAYTKEQYSAFDLERSLEGKEMIWNLLPQPNLDSMLELSKNNLNLENEYGSYLHRGIDLFVYPNGQTRTRHSIYVQVSGNKAIDEWKEVSIPFNPSYQKLQVLSAEAYGEQGSITQADRNKNQMVFKDLRPNSVIKIEWLITDEYQDLLRGQTFGQITSSAAYALNRAQIRLLNTSNHPVELKLGQNFNHQKSALEGYPLDEWNLNPIHPINKESFLSPNQKIHRIAQFSSLTSWKSISNWYHSLSYVDTTELSSLKPFADSLFIGTKNDLEKVQRIHQYIIKNIHYSSVPFRQSGWIPQQPISVLESKIGDCKDMALLAVALLKIAKIKSSLVLVNTDYKGKTEDLLPSPTHFNHCIVGFYLNNQKHFMDLTANFNSIDLLPMQDQGAFSLWIDPNVESPEHLPFEPLTQRKLERRVKEEINDLGLHEIWVQSKRRGNSASSFKENYSELSINEQLQKMQQTIAIDRNDAKLLNFDLNLPKYLKADSLEYQTHYTFSNPQPKSGNLWILPLELTDAITDTDIPSGNPRINAIECPYIWNARQHNIEEHSLKIPKSWNLMQIPKDQTWISPIGSYQLKFKYSPGQLTYSRTFKVNCTEVLNNERMQQYLEWLRKISQSDQQKLVFQAND